MRPGAPDECPPAWLKGGGETGALVRALDWSRTPLGPLASWPDSLKVTVATLLASRHPMFLWWGEQLIQIYNDAYVPSFDAGKHPTALGQRGVDCWTDSWPRIKSRIDDVMQTGTSSWHEDALVPIARNGRVEEVYWTYGYSPVISGDGIIQGALAVCTETTARVVAERRYSVLRLLARNTAKSTTAAAILMTASQIFEDSHGDTPFALLYRIDPVNGDVVLAQWVGLHDEQRAALDGVCRAAFDSNVGELLDLSKGGSGVAFPGRPWPEPTTTAFIAPMLGDGKEARPQGYVVFGLSPRLPFTDAYREHLLQLGEHLGLALARVEMYRVREAAAYERDNLLMKAPVATAIMRGPEHVFELANSLYCRMVNRFDLVGKRYLDAFPELADGPLPAILDDVFLKGEPYASGEMAVELDKKGDGKLEDCFFTFNLEPLREERGRVYGMMAVAVEITDQVNARRGRDNLLRELEAANRAKDEFLAMLGHELRNPLSPIVTALHLMRRGAAGEPAHEHQIIERQVGHLVRLVDDLLDVSKISRGMIALRKEPIELSTVVAKGVEAASDLFEERRHRLSIDVPAEGLTIDGDPIRLAQVVANLLTNAARYTDPSGVISVRAFRDGEEIVLQVTDNGMGIPPGLLPRIFDLFVQGERTSERKEGGLGLGLALVKSLALLHGGSVYARSDGERKGSEFEVRLPMTTRPVTRDVVVTSKPPMPLEGAGNRVLVVDDNVDSVEMLSEMFGASGYEVAVAHDGPGALAVAERFVPDVALLDIGLPVMDGYEVGRRLRANPRTANCRLIALTGYGQDHDRQRSRDAGFELHLVKPVDVERLLDIISGAQEAPVSRRI